MNKRLGSSVSIKPRAAPAAGVEGFELPLALSHLPAGFPSPADDYLEQSLDIGAYLVRRKGTTFFMRVSGDSMIGSGINDGDLLVIDRAERPCDGAIIVARIYDEFCVKQLRIIEGKIWLYPANERYKSIEIMEGMDFEIWGRVTHSITSHCESSQARLSKIK